MSEIVSLYTDGGVIGRNPSPIGGTWAWCMVDAEGERVRCDSGVLRPFRIDPKTGRPAPVTNNNSELVALTRGLLALPAGWSGKVCCDSKCALGWLFWNWMHIDVPDLLYSRGIEAVRRLRRVTVVHLDGHPKPEHLAAGVGKRGNPVSEHNVWCDAACTAAAKAYLASLEGAAS